MWILILLTQSFWNIFSSLFTIILEVSSSVFFLCLYLTAATIQVGILLQVKELSQMLTTVLFTISKQILENFIISILVDLYVPRQI